MQIEVTVPMNDTTYHGVYRMHLWRRHKLWIIIRSALCVCAVGYGGFLLTTKGSHVFASVLVTMGTLGFLRPLIWQMLHERGLRKHPTYGKNIRYIFNETQVGVDGSKGQVNVLWSEVIDFYHNKKGLLIYINKSSYLWFPRSLLSLAEVEQLESWWRNPQ